MQLLKMLGIQVGDESPDSVAHKQSLFPYRDSRAKRTRKRTRKSPATWKCDARLMSLQLTTHSCHVSTRQANFAFTCVFFLHNYPWTERETAWGLQKAGKNCGEIFDSLTLQISCPTFLFQNLTLFLFIPGRCWIRVALDICNVHDTEK